MVFGSTGFGITDSCGATGVAIMGAALGGAKVCMANSCCGDAGGANTGLGAKTGVGLGEGSE